MTQIIPNTQAVPQVIVTAPVIINGSNHNWIPSQIMHGVKVIHVGDYSFSAEETGSGAAELKIILQRDIGSGWEDQPGEVSGLTFVTGQDRRFRVLCKVPYYDGVDAGVLPKYRLLAECPTGQVTLHSAEGSDGVPSGQWKAEYGFEGDEPTIEVVISLHVSSDYNIVRPTTWPVLGNITNSFFASCGDGRFVTFFRGDGVSEGYEAVVWVVDGINISDYPVITQGITLQLPGGSNLADYANSMFISCGAGKSISSFQDFGVIDTYIADIGGGLSLTARHPVADYPIPAAYGDVPYCSRAAITYIPATDKVIFLMQLGAAGDYQPHTRSSTLDGNGVFANHDISFGNVWDATIEYVDIESWICSGAVGGNGDFIIFANLYDNSARRFSFIHQNVNSSGALSSFTETNFPRVSYGYTFEAPVAIIGDPNSDRFVALLSSGTLLFAMLCTVSSGSVTTSTPLLLGTLTSLSAKQGSGKWITSSDYLMVQFSNATDLSYIILDASGITVTLAESKQFLNEGSGSSLGQVVFDPVKDYFVSCYQHDAISASNSHHRTRVASYEERENIEMFSGVPVSVVTAVAGVGSYYKITSSAIHTTLTVTLTGLSAGHDLYVKAMSRPTDSIFDDSSTNAGATDEQCDLVNTGITTWYIGVDGVEAGNCTLTATLS